LGIDNTLGSIEINKIADLVAIKGNPVNDINNIKNIVFVMKDGEKVLTNYE